MTLPAPKKYKIFLNTVCICICIFLIISTFSIPEIRSDRACLKNKEKLNLPKQYGRVIYNKQGEPNKEVYIIFQAHRSVTTGENNQLTIKVQSDIYRIEEWLVRNKKVQLLLPEGYFKKETHKKGEKSKVKSGCSTDQKISIQPIDDLTLERELSDTAAFMNADKLLYRSSSVRIQQIEDKNLYYKVHGYLTKLKDLPQCSKERKYSRLVYLQDRRTAHLLQKLPQIIEKEFQKGVIGSRKAIFTIGMAHAPQILRFVNKNYIAKPLVKSSNPKKMHKLNLIEKGYQVIMIMPKTLIKISDQFGLSLPEHG